MLKNLGYKETDRLLIVNADDYGMCHAANTGITQLLSEGAISSATVMVPCPWAAEAAEIAKQHPEFDIGIHLTLTNERKFYKWGPVTRDGGVDSLINPHGFLLRNSEEVETYAKPEQVRKELRNQVLAGIKLGIDPTHLDSHMGSVYGLITGNDFLVEVLDICAEFGLPFRLPRNMDAYKTDANPAIRKMIEERIQYADQLGVVLIDYLLGLPYSLKEGETYSSVKQEVIGMLRNLKPGVTELIIHPCHITEELKAVMDSTEKRHVEFELFRDEDVKRVLEEENIQLVHWRLLRDYQRSM